MVGYAVARNCSDVGNGAGRGCSSDFAMRAETAAERALISARS